MVLHIINSGVNSGEKNMQMDEALLDYGNPVLRFYSWERPSVSLGYSQDIGAVDSEYCKFNEIPIIRRITGGGAVLHDNELTYCIVCNESYLPKSITESYKLISIAILNALRTFGFNVEMKSDDVTRSRSKICFEEPSWYEITIDNKKVVGSAQRRINGKILQHGSILFKFDLETNSKVFKVSKEHLEKRINWLTRYKEVDKDALINKLSENFAKLFA